jgi:hypothetical protein
MDKVIVIRHSDE